MCLTINTDTYNVIIDPKKCNDCGKCIEVCPDKIFKIEGESIRVSGQCEEIDCRACQNECQENAIYLK